MLVSSPPHASASPIGPAASGAGGFTTSPTNSLNARCADATSPADNDSVNAANFLFRDSDIAMGHTSSPTDAISGNKQEPSTIEGHHAFTAQVSARSGNAKFPARSKQKGPKGTHS
jgi:hypothetical protein